MLTELSNIIKEICDLFLQRSSERCFDVMKRRFGLENTEVETLETIGSSYGVTRERVRQIEASVLELLKPLFQEGSYHKHFARRVKSYYLPENIRKEINDFQVYLKKEPFILEPSYITDYFVQDTQLYKGELKLLMECLGYTYYFSYTPRLIDIKQGWSINDLKVLINEADQLSKLFSEEKEFTLDEVKNRVNENIAMHLHYFESLEVIKNDQNIEIVQMPFSIISTTDRAYRLLKQFGNLTIEQIQNIINTQIEDKVLLASNLRNQMVGDKRFEPIGKSGVWRIRGSSSLKNISIVKAMEEILENSEEPLTFEVLLDELKVVRGDSFDPKSVKIYLATKPQFCKLVDGRFTLANEKSQSFVIKEKRKQVNMAHFNDELRKILPIGESKALSSVVKALQDKGFNPQTIRARLAQLEQKGCIEDITPKQQSHRVITAINYSDIKLAKRKTQREIIQEIILQILSEHSEKMILKGKLYELVNAKYPCVRQTFYRYLSEISEELVISYQENMKYYVKLNG